MRCWTGPESSQGAHIQLNCHATVAGERRSTLFWFGSTPATPDAVTYQQFHGGTRYTSWNHSAKLSSPSSFITFVRAAPMQSNCASVLHSWRHCSGGMKKAGGSWVGSHLKGGVRRYPDARKNERITHLCSEHHESEEVLVEEARAGHPSHLRPAHAKTCF